MVDALGVGVRHGVDKLQHEAPHMLRLQRAMADADRLVQVTARAELDHQVDMGIRLERVDEVDDVGMRSELAVQHQLFGLVVDGEVEEALRCGRLLSQALDGDRLVRPGVLGHEDHAEGAMVERRDGLIPTTEHDAIVKAVAKALHCDGIRNIRVSVGVECVVIQDPNELLPYPQAGLCRDRVRSYRDKVSNLYNGGGGAMSGRNEAGSEERDVQGRKAAKENKTKGSESFTIRGSWEDRLVQQQKGMEVEESRKKGWTSGPEKKQKEWSL